MTPTPHPSPAPGTPAPVRALQPFCKRCGSSRCRDSAAHAASGRR